LILHINISLDVWRDKMCIGRFVEIIQAEWRGVCFFSTTYVNNPKSCAVTVTAICIQKYLLLIDYRNAHIVEFVPQAAVVVFDIEEVVSSFRSTVMNTHCVQRICSFIIFYW
jgi:hypothetical protein